MDINNFVKEQKEIMKHHEKKLNNLRNKNQSKRKDVNNIINKKIVDFEARKKRNSDTFNLIRNKRQ
ncbi:hypothetical protein RVS70_07380 [Virgibacillus sp. M23]|uniref:hypothetical protein n=1 Tax=Virgibacillus sp. M23 TaxID=3079030 RepID=UPI002A91C9E5|nr:hypothetical protein [Virgibacillus sp. M23]MDY7044026.1 hypothetical protein [Virgibacillus sp. M23]